MKIGLDSNKREFSRKNIEKFREKENFIVDMNSMSNINEGYRLHKLIMEINSSKLDLFIGVYLKETIEEEVIVYYDKSFEGKKFAGYAYEILRENLDVKNLKLMNGEKFYVLEGSSVPSILIKSKGRMEKIEKALCEVVEKILSLEK